jgi:uncharacterized membrane protein YeaQ/YmgE (transglycosylase-associated protein family)
MHISGEGLLIILLVGLIAGWLAGELVGGGSYGIVGDMAIGIVGALIGTWILRRTGMRIGSGLVTSILVATFGAVIAHLLGGDYPYRRYGRR